MMADSYSASGELHYGPVCLLVSLSLGTLLHPDPAALPRATDKHAQAIIHQKSKVDCSYECTDVLF